MTYLPFQDHVPLIVWDLTTDQPLFTFRPEAVRDFGFIGSLHFSSDGTRLVAGDKYAGIIVWEITPTGEFHKCWDNWGKTKALVVRTNHDGRHILSTGGFHDNYAKLWNTTQESCLLKIKGHGAGVYLADMARNGDIIAFAADNPAPHLRISKDFALKICFLEPAKVPATC